MEVGQYVASQVFLLGVRLVPTCVTICGVALAGQFFPWHGFFTLSVRNGCEHIAFFFLSLSVQSQVQVREAIFTCGNMFSDAFARFTV